jgi:hypothetical protein
MRKKKPDLMLVLAVLIGFGVLVTEMAHGEIFSSPHENAVVLH